MRLAFLLFLTGCVTQGFYYKNVVKIKFTGENSFYSEACSDTGILAGRYSDYLYLVKVSCGDEEVILLVDSSDMKHLEDN